MFPYDPEQSTNCCSEMLAKPDPKMALADSKEAVVEKAQQDPHCP